MLIDPIKVRCQCNVDKVRKFAHNFPQHLPCKPNVGDTIVIPTGMKSSITGMNFDIELKVCRVSFLPKFKHYGHDEREWELVVDLHFRDGLSINQIDKWFMDHIGV